MSQSTNLALLISAILHNRTFNSRTWPEPIQSSNERRGENSKHDLLHRLKRLNRFLGSGRVDDIAVQTDLISHTLAHPGAPLHLGLAMVWAIFNRLIPKGKRGRYQALRITVPRRSLASTVSK